MGNCPLYPASGSWVHGFFAFAHKMDYRGQLPIKWPNWTSQAWLKLLVNYLKIMCLTSEKAGQTEMQIISTIKHILGTFLGIVTAAIIITYSSKNNLSPFDYKWLFAILLLVLPSLYIQALVINTILKAVAKLKSVIVYKHVFTSYTFALTWAISSYYLIDTVLKIKRLWLDNALFAACVVFISNAIFFILLVVFSKLRVKWERVMLFAFVCFCTSW